MADRAYIIPLRNDLAGMGMQVTDLVPNTSLLNPIYDGPGQSGYLRYSFDTPDVTVVSGSSYVSGSLNTSPLVALADDDTTGGGNDCQATTVTQCGLLAYLQDRVQPGGTVLATDNPATLAQAASMATAIRALVTAGSPLTLASINTALVSAVANTELASSGTSRSFGTVEEVMRILQGEAYVVPAFTIIGTDAGGTDQFLALAARQILEAAQDTALNGGITFAASGHFLVRGEPGFRDIRPILLSGAVRASAGEGVLSGYALTTMAYNNPNFVYAASTGPLLRARTIDGTVIPATGVGAVVAVYDNVGNLLT